MLRQAGGPQSAPAAPAVPVPAAPAAASIPRYYVALADTGRTSAPTQAEVTDDRTGKMVAYANPFPGERFSGVTAAADDQTFVLSSYQAARKETTFYLLRLTSGITGGGRLTRLPIRALPAQVTGLALSPDGRELAVMSSAAPTSTNTRPQLTVYSLPSGAARHRPHLPPGQAAPGHHHPVRRLRGRPLHAVPCLGHPQDVAASPGGIAF
jgi:hypothetical protein